jgi:hypothetical protein
METKLYVNLSFVSVETFAGGNKHCIGVYQEYNRNMLISKKLCDSRT